VEQLAENPQQSKETKMNSYGSFDAMAAGTGALTGGGSMTVFNADGKALQDQTMQTLKHAAGFIRGAQEAYTDEGDFDKTLGHMQEAQKYLNESLELARQVYAARMEEFHAEGGDAMFGKSWERDIRSRESVE
jgi:hypothetical protein